MSATAKSGKVRARRGAAHGKSRKSKVPHRGAAKPVKREIGRAAKRAGIKPRTETQAERQARVWRAMQDRAERDRSELRLTPWRHSALSEPETLGDWLTLLLTGSGGYGPDHDDGLMIRSVLVAIAQDVESLAGAELSNRTMRDNFGSAHVRDQYGQIMRASARARAAAELLPRILKANAGVKP